MHLTVPFQAEAVDRDQARPPTENQPILSQLERVERAIPWQSSSRCFLTVSRSDRDGNVSLLNGLDLFDFTQRTSEAAGNRGPPDGCGFGHLF